MDARAQAVGAVRVKDIAGLEGLYSITDEGEVISRRWGYERRLSTTITSDGYPSIRLMVLGRTYSFLVHRLVAAAFCEPFDGECVNHKDGDRLNCHHTNLEWCSSFADSLHAVFRRSGIDITGQQIMEIQTLQHEPLPKVALRYNVPGSAVLRIWAGKKAK